MNNNPVPQIYAGASFLEKIVATMEQSRSAMSDYRHTDWVDLLSQFYAWVSGFIQDDTIQEDLKQLSRRCYNFERLIRSNRSFRSMSGDKVWALRQDILAMESRLFTLARDVLIKIQEQDDKTDLRFLK